MFDATLVDVGIGLALIFFIVASIVAAMNEVVTKLLDIRAKVLWKALAHSLDDGAGAPFKLGFGALLTGFARATHRRPEILGTLAAGASHRAPRNTALVKALGARTRGTGTKSNRTKVDQIAASTFSSALLQAATLGGNDLLNALREADTAARLAAAPDPDPTRVVAGWPLATSGRAGLDAALNELGLAPTLADPLDAAAKAWTAAADADADAARTADAVATNGALRDGIQAVRLALEDPTVRSKLDVESVRKLRSEVGGGPLGEILDGAIASGRSALTDATDAINTWFDAQMERVGELYARATKFVLFFAGLALAVILNVNAITLPQELRDNADARAALVAAAGSCPAAASTTSVPTGEEQAPTDDPTAASRACAEKITEDLRANANAITLPVVGRYKSFWDALHRSDAEQEWVDAVAAAKQAGTDPELPLPGSPPDPALVWVVLGWLLTAGAVSFGAPFWYDVVQRLTANRSKLAKGAS
ncbi:MAG: hypothetical protein R2711_14045 [Acidimicrobiales bacterium]